MSDALSLKDLIAPDAVSKSGRSWKVLAVLLGAVALLLSLVQLVVVHSFSPNWRYIAQNSPSARGQNLLVLDDPYLTDLAVMNWAGRVAADIRTMGYGDYDERIVDKYPVYFTDNGYLKFVQRFVDNGYIEAIERNKQNYIAVIRDQPIIVWKGWVGTSYNWVVQVRLGTGVEVLGEKNSPPLKDLTVQLRIVMMDKSERPSGLAIDNWFEMNGN